MTSSLTPRHPFLGLLARNARSDPPATGATIAAIPLSGSLTRGWNVPVQPQVDHDLTVDVPCVTNQEIDDASARRGPEKSRRHRDPLEHGLVVLFLDQRDPVVERVIHRLDRGGLARG